MNYSVSKNVSILLFIIIVGSLIYSNILEAPFVLDDGKNIKNNTYIRIHEINIDSLVKAVFNKKSSSMRPIGRISFALNYYFHQYRLKGYHVVNIVIHILSGILLYFFIKTTLSISTLQSKYNNPDLIAFFAAMIWLVHPLHTQSVTYIVQRMNSMSAMFCLLSLLLYATGRIRQKQHIPLNPQSKTETKPEAASFTKNRKTGKRFRLSVASLYFSGTVVAWLMALGSKENAAVLPFFIFLYEWYFFQDLDREWLKRNMKFIFVTVMLFGLMAFIFLGTNPLEKLKSINDFANHEFTFKERVLTQPRVVIYYLSLLFYPHPSRLNLDYDFPLSHSLIDPVTTLLSLFTIIGLVGLAICLAKRERFLSFCILWFFGNLVIESSVIPLAIIFEHRTYLPSMLIILLAIMLGQRFIKLKWAGVVMVCVVTVVFSFWTYQRNNVWSDPIELWSGCVKKSPNKARPHNNLGNVLKKQGRMDDAIKHYEEALRINPYYYKAHNNLGNALKKQGHVEDAIKHYEEALRINPDFAEAHNNLGNVLQKQNRMDDAIKHHKEALRIKHDYEEAHYNLGNALLKQGLMDDAIKHYMEALRINPDLAEAHNNVGHALQKKGRVDDAIKHYKEAFRIKPDLKIAHNKLGNALLLKGDIDGAIEHFRKALQINPNYINAKNNLKKALAIQKQGR